MSAPPLITTERLLVSLRLLCSQPSHPGQHADLAATSEIVATLLRGIQMQVLVVPTPAAPVVIGWRNGRLPGKVLLYHHYDSAPPGPWRAWSHEPYQLAERDDAVYGRGVAHGKGPLVAHIEALHMLLQAEDELPCGVIFVVEGAALSGSPGLAEVLEAQRDLLQADLCLGSAGDCDTEGRPFCYSGAKGLLQVRLTARGPRYPLAPGLATSVRNPIWRLLAALTSVKGDDEDIKIAGFYDQVEGLNRDENSLLRQVALDEAGRLAAWQISEFLFGMSGPALARAEVMLPTCNLTSLVSEPAGDLATVPSGATALLEFQLVPHQSPALISTLLRDYLIDRDFQDIVVELLPGSYPPVRTPDDESMLARLAAAGATDDHPAPLQILPFGPFTLPLQLFAVACNMPTASLGVTGYTSATRGPDEHIAVEHLLRHGRIMSELLRGGMGTRH